MLERVRAPKRCLRPRSSLFVSVLNSSGYKHNSTKYVSLCRLCGHQFDLSAVKLFDQHKSRRRASWCNKSSAAMISRSLVWLDCGRPARLVAVRTTMSPFWLPAASSINRSGPFSRPCTRVLFLVPAALAAFAAEHNKWPAPPNARLLCCSATSLRLQITIRKLWLDRRTEIITDYSGRAPS